jgi:hypothetical protein
MGPGQIEMEALGQELAQVRFTKLYRDHGRAVLEYGRWSLDGRCAAGLDASTDVGNRARRARTPKPVRARRFGSRESREQPFADEAPPSPC